MLNGLRWASEISTGVLSLFIIDTINNLGSDLIFLGLGGVRWSSTNGDWSAGAGSACRSTG
jgi:hypothetical protein